MKLFWLLIVGIILFPTVWAQCTDQPPPPGSDGKVYKCSDQKKWGKCGKIWMIGFCRVSCGTCPSTTRPAPFQITGKLSVQGKNLKMNGQTVFLNGANMAWQNYGSDFGSSGYNNYPYQIKQAMQQISAAGGNSIRMWVHCSGYNSPTWGNNGQVTGVTPEFLSSVKQFLQDAKSYNIFVTLVLWNFMITDAHQALYTDDTVLQSYIDNALKKMVAAWKDEPALAAWEISNEPEGTSKEYGWQPKPNQVPMAQIQKAINWQADAIHNWDPTALVTVGSWSAQASSDVGGCEKLNKDWGACQNYYTNKELFNAGGRDKGYLDFYQMHYYAWQRRDVQWSLIDNPASYYKLDKPLIMGEFSQAATPDDIKIEQIYGWAYANGYSGAWAWQFAGGQNSDTPDVILRGIASIGKNNQALVYDVQLNGDINGDFDVPPALTTSDSTLSMAAIVGISIGGAVILLALLMGGIMYSRRKQHAVTVAHLQQTQEMSPLPATQATQV